MNFGIPAFRFKSINARYGMKTPLSYYGGKQLLAKTILGLFPPHQVYCEPFLGGAAVFFAKEPSKVEIVNDTNGELINFYEVLKRDYTALEKEVDISLHSRKLHKHAQGVYENPELFDRIKRAWAVWMLANSSYGNILDGGFCYDKTTGGTTKKLANKRLNFTGEYAIRLQNTQIESGDALKIIRSRDSAEAFFYCDPPYVGADQGHYVGYTQEDFVGLLGLLETVKGKFLLSSFRNKALTEAIERNGWHSFEIKMYCPMTNKLGKTRKKIEVFTANYPIKTPDKKA
jgi:DNA adenine methylase